MRSMLSLPHRSRTCALGLALAVLSVAALGNVSSAKASADPICQETTITLHPDADAWVDEDGAFNNGGSDAILMVRSAVPSKNARALVRFPLPAAVPAGCAIEFAKLRLFAPTGDSSSRLEVARLAFGWSENLVTWGTQPATVGPPATAWGGEGYVQWNVKSQVEAMLESANHGLVIRDAVESDEAGGSQAFHGREKGENPPELVIRFAAPKTEAPGPPAPPTPAAVTCGQELTASVLLTNDLTNCPGDGLVIGKDRIIVDLGGHTIDGVGLGSGLRNDGYDSVTVRNGTIQDFDYGVQLLPETDLNLIERLSLHDNQLAAVELSDAGELLAGNEVRANLIEGNGDGIALLKGTTATLVAGNTMRLNSGPGLYVAQSDANRLEGNMVSGSGDLGVGLEHASGNVLLRNTISSNSDGGIEIVAGSNDNRVEDNTVSESGDTGILVAESERNEVVGNLSELMSDSGITLDVANDGVVRDNSVRFNPGGIQLDGSSRNLIESNHASETLGIGIELGGGSLANHVVRNEASANGAQGIYVGDEALAREGNLIERNVASGNSADGIATAKGGHTLSFNRADDNGGWGVYAAPDTIDGRGNVALRNGDPAQCFGIVCNADVTSPETEIDDGPDDPTDSAEASFSFAGEDDRAAAAALRFECRLDGESFTACSSPELYTGLGEGEHRFEVRAIDLAGNVDPSPAGYSWTVDTVGPETSIASGPADPSGERSASFEFTASEPGSSFECRLDGEVAFAPCSSPASYTDLGEGAHTFEVRAVDRAGNVDLSAASYSWTVDTGPPEPPADTTPPETSIGSGPADPSASASAGFSFAGSDDRSEAAELRFECRLDNAVFGFADCSSPQAYTELGDGSHTFEVRAVDGAGNVDPSPASHGWIVDTTAPETSIDSGPANPSGSAAASFSFGASGEAGSRFECSLDGAPFAACESPKDYTGLSDGPHTFEVRAVDGAGNVDSSPASHAWTVDTAPPEPPADTTPPQTTLGDRPGDPSASASASFSFGGEDDRTEAAALRFECRLDSASVFEFTDCSSPKSYPDLPDGTYTFEVRAVDGAGNVDPSPEIHSWTVDTTPPETTLGDRPADPSSSAAATFSFASDEAGSRLECSLDGAAFAACESPKDYAGLADGAHAFEVRAVDEAGNVDISPASHHWTVDTTAPETTIDSGPPETTSNTGSTLTFSASQTGSRFECRLDDESFEACSSPKAYSGLTTGSHTFQVRATDLAGNVDQTPASRTWTVVPPPPACAATTITTASVADSWVLQSSARSNYRNDSVLKVDTKSGANARVLVRLALPAIPLGCQVTDAKLRLYASSYKTGRTLQALRIAANWTETSVTWANQPGTTGVAATAPSARGYVQWTVTPQVQAMYSSGNHGFLIRDSAENGRGIEQGFNSREKGADNPPRLVLTFGSP